MYIVKKQEIILFGAPLLCLLFSLLFAGCGGAGTATTPSVMPSAFQTTLRVVPQTWAKTHAPVPIGPLVVFVDLARMRTDLELPPITGESSREEKQILLRSLNTQGLQFSALPVGLGDEAFQEWGWDLADIDQALYLADIEASIFWGNFSRPQVPDRLVQKGYTRGASGDFATFTSETMRLQLAWKPDMLIACPRYEETDVLAWLMELATGQQPGLDTYPAAIATMEQIGDSWGVLLSPSPDYPALDQELRAMQDQLRYLCPDPSCEELFGTRGEVLPAGWDLMAIAYQGVGDETLLTFVYHYPSAGEAQQDVELVRQTLTETPRLAAARGLLWGDYMTLDSVEVRGTLIVAQLRTKSPGLIGTALAKRDYWGFLPIRIK